LLLAESAVPDAGGEVMLAQCRSSGCLAPRLDGVELSLGDELVGWGKARG